MVALLKEGDKARPQRCGALRLDTRITLHGVSVAEAFGDLGLLPATPIGRNASGESLEEERHKHLDAGGTDHGNFRRFVIPLAMPSKAVYDELAGWGVDATVVMPWGVENPECASLEAKLEAMQRFADTYL